MYGTMAANDAFTAGVRPGGLTSSTEIRLLLCYLVKNAGPITRQEIENALMEEALVNYFEIGSCLDDITKQETDIDPDLTPEDWTTGNEEDIEIGTKEDFITPGGQANDWQQGEDEQVTFDSTNLQFR